MNDPRRSPSIFTRGAVDLSAFRGSSANAASPATTPATTPSTTKPPVGTSEGTSPQNGAGVTIVDVTEATFHSEVLERSHQKPVIVDFWAQWCDPCRQLSPLLEKLAHEANGMWVLAKVDVEANQRLAQRLRVQGIPLVYAIVGGQPIDAFSGVIPERQLRQWIEAVCQAAGVEAAAVEDPRLSTADEALATGNLDMAEAEYKKILADSPADAVAESGLAQIGLLRRTLTVDFQDALATARAQPLDVAAQIVAADVEMLMGETTMAYNRLIDVVRKTSGDDREMVRRHLLSLFMIAGPDDPSVASARRALANALF